MSDTPGSAEPQLRKNNEWRSRGYLPHRDRIGLLQSITFRLADSLPQEKLRELEEELERMKMKEKDAELGLRDPRKEKDAELGLRDPRKEEEAELGLRDPGKEEDAELGLRDPRFWEGSGGRDLIHRERCLM
jgi:hypothetical protein